MHDGIDMRPNGEPAAHFSIASAAETCRSWLTRWIKLLGSCFGQEAQTGL